MNIEKSIFVLCKVKLTVSELELNAADKRKFGDDIDIPRHGSFCPTSETQQNEHLKYRFMSNDNFTFHTYY